MDETDSQVSPSISVNHLSFAFPDGSPGLKDVTISLPPRSRTLLVGANGSGKTTLLRLLSGKRLAPHNSVSVGGVDPFSHGLEGVAYLGTEWVLNPIVRTDMDVPALLSSVGGDAYPARRDQLVGMLDIDLRWRMHAVSDGERRRVQLAMGLLRPWSVLLLDEVTVDLDLLSRSDFLAFLRSETETRPCTVVYATHIFDNLDGWPTHLVHLHLGSAKEWGEARRFLEDKESGQGGEGSRGRRLGEVALAWLRQDLKERGPRQPLEVGGEVETRGGQAECS